MHSKPSGAIYSPPKVERLNLCVFLRVYSMTVCWKPIQGQSTCWHGCLTKSFGSARGHWIRRGQAQMDAFSSRIYLTSLREVMGGTWDRIHGGTLFADFFIGSSSANFLTYPSPTCLWMVLSMGPPTSISNQDNLSETLDGGKPSVGMPSSQVTLCCVQLAMKTNQDIKLDLIANKSNPYELIKIYSQGLLLCKT